MSGDGLKKLEMCVYNCVSIEATLVVQILHTTRYRPPIVQSGRKANIAFALPKSSLTGNVRVFSFRRREREKYSTKKKDIGFLKYNRSYCY